MEIARSDQLAAAESRAAGYMRKNVRLNYGRVVVIRRMRKRTLVFTVCAFISAICAGAWLGYKWYALPADEGQAIYLRLDLAVPT
jgi:hypothetical protein